MRITTGFQLSQVALSADIPDHFNWYRESCSCVRIATSGTVKTVLSAESSAKARFLAEANLKARAESVRGQTKVTTYGQYDPKNGYFLRKVLIYEAAPGHRDVGFAWVALDLHDDPLAEGAFSKHITPVRDHLGVTRLQLEPPLMPASPIHPGYRELVTFLARPEPHNVQAVRFTHSGALATDTARDLPSSAARSTAAGVVVTCDGGHGTQPGALAALANTIAQTVERV